MILFLLHQKDMRRNANSLHSFEKGINLILFSLWLIKRHHIAETFGAPEKRDI